MTDVLQGDEGELVVVVVVDVVVGTDKVTSLMNLVAGFNGLVETFSFKGDDFSNLIYKIRRES